MSNFVLHNYFRSSTSIRVRAALALKKIPYEYRSYHLRKGENRSEAYLARNTQGLVPSLDVGGLQLSQSLAIIEYLDETIPSPPLLPSDPAGRARVRSLAQIIACEIHPLNNLRVLNFVRERYGADDAGIGEWFRHWVGLSFEPFERRLSEEPQTGRFCHGDTPGLADLCLFAQVLNNTRFDVDMAPYPTIRRIYDACLQIEAFQEALPGRQPDTE